MRSFRSLLPAPRRPLRWESSPTGRVAALEALGTDALAMADEIFRILETAPELKAKVLEMLIHHSRDPKEDIRLNAVKVMGRCGNSDERVVARLNTVMTSREETTELRAEAARALGRAARLKAIPLLNEALSVEKDPLVRKEILVAWEFAVNEAYLEQWGFEES